jgi:glycine cleavage system H protein
VRVEGNTAYIGISDYAQDELGDVVYLDLPWDDVGSRSLAAGEHFGDIESVKATSELFTPVSGQLAQVNEALKDRAELVNSDAYGEGWMLAVTLSEPAELDKLMDAAAYTKFLETAGH